MMCKKTLHITLFFYFSLLTFDLFGQQTEKVYLSGTGSDHTVNWEFMCTGGMNANKWTTIPVPSCWELQGFGKYDYGFAKDSIRGKEKGLYKYSFNAPGAWKNKIVKIVFEGSMTDTEVKINGQLAGEIHQGAFYAFKYDITELLKFGEKNLLEVTVLKHSANESVNAAERRADFWIFGGIFRPVYLEILPEVYIENFTINAKADGTLAAVVKTNRWADHNATLKIYNAGGAVVNELKAVDIGSNYSLFPFFGTFPSLKLWTPESPTLYKAVFTIYKDGKVWHTVTQKFGFRTVEVKQRDGIYVNGVKVKMKGVNRHSFWPASGRTTSKKISVDDVLLIKDMNMNAVRMSHYPPDDHFLDVCDSLGLFVMDELAGWHGHYDTPTGTRLLKEMIAHDVNHPSIIIWSNGNEGGHNLELDTLFKQYDIQQRPVIHPWQLYNGIETQHYREYNYGIGNYENGKEIVMPTEFLHGQFDGGHGAGLEDYWEKMWHDPLSAGGFLWDFADQAVVRKDLHDSLDTDKFRAADGIVGPHHEKEGSYYAIKEIWSPVYFERKEITDLFDGRLNVENRYHFTNLNQCSFSWKLQKLYGNGEKQGVITSPVIAPLEKGSLQIPLPADWKQYDVLYVTVKDTFQRTIFTWSWPLHRPSIPRPGNPDPDISSAPRIRKPIGNDSLYIVDYNNGQFSFNRRTGMLMEVKRYGNTIPLSGGPTLCEGQALPDSVVIEESFSNVTIECKYGQKSLIHSLIWYVDSRGRLTMTISYFPAAYFTKMAGVNFSFPEQQIRGVEYIGDGPYRVWKNRLKGNSFGAWKKEYNTTETGEWPFVYPEFKGYYSNIYQCKFLMKNGKSFTVYTTNENLFVRLFTPAWKTDQWHNYEPFFPPGDISFMQGIPGIGSKTQRAVTTGPMGMENIYYDYEKDPSRALKMVLCFDFREIGQQ